MRFFKKWLLSHQIIFSFSVLIALTITLGVLLVVTLGATVERLFTYTEEDLPQLDLLREITRDISMIQNSSLRYLIVPRSLWRLFTAAVHFGAAENVNFDVDWQGAFGAGSGPQGRYSTGAIWWSRHESIFFVSGMGFPQSACELR